MSEQNPFSHFADALKKAVGAKPAEKPVPEKPALPTIAKEYPPLKPLFRESPGRLSPSHPEGFVDEWKTVDGVRYRKYDTGFTVAEYFNHPGPGWDFRWGAMEQYGIDDFDPLKLPDDTYYCWYTEDQENMMSP